MSNSPRKRSDPPQGTGSPLKFATHRSGQKTVRFGEMVAKIMGTVVIGSRGSGKSVLLGFMALMDILKNTPVVILDPTGGTLNFLFTLIALLPKVLRDKIWQRIIYVDPACPSGYGVAFPLLYKLHENECLYDIAQRFLNILKFQDPHLVEAPVTGWVRRMA